MTEDPEPIQDADSIEALTAVDRATLKKLTRFHTGAELSGLLLRAHNRVGRYLSGERDLPQREKMVVLQAAGISPWLYHELLRAELPEPSPAEILRQLCRDPNHVCADPFLIELEQALEGIRQKPIVDGPGFEGFAEELAEIEELRHLSVALAREQLSALLWAQLDLAKTTESPSVDLVRQLAQAVGTLAILSWLDREFLDSCDAFCLAFGLAAFVEDPQLNISLKHRASYLVADCGFLAYSKVWLQDALEFYERTHGGEKGKGRVLVDLGRVEFHQANMAVGARLLEQALTILPEEDFRFRVAALEILSNCQQAMGRADLAKATLSQAFAEYGDRRDSFRGYLAWVQARLARQSGDLESAQSHYSEAVDLLRRFGGVLSPDLALLDFAEFRVLQGMKTKDLGALVMTWLKEGRYDAKTAQIAARAVRVFTQEAATLAELADLRLRFEQTGGVTVPPRLK